MIGAKHRRFIKFALKVAQESPAKQRQRLGCVIVSRNAPVSYGFNKMFKTHPRAVKYRFPFLHAELAAIINANRADLNRATAYIARARRVSPMGLAYPCPVCMEFFREFGIKDFYFTQDDGSIGYETFV
jgi:tRNA(Arg) A34 adenosine deaminase TadA